MKKTIEIDNQKIALQDNMTILAAAQKMNIFIPTFCYEKGYEPCASCRICLVLEINSNTLVPACATLATDGMTIVTRSSDIFEARKVTLELLLSEHRGNCLAPCQNVCYLDLDIPLMIQNIKKGNYRKALEIINDDLVLPQVICKICSAPCQKACNRKKYDRSISIRGLVEHVLENTGRTDFDISGDKKNNFRVAVIGADLTGLTVAHYLLKYGYEVHIYEQQAKPEDLLNNLVGKMLPKKILAIEINSQKKMGGQFILGHRVKKEKLYELGKKYSALVIATRDMEFNEYSVSGKTFQTDNKKIFKVKGALSLNKNIVGSMGRGKKCAQAVHQFLTDEKVKAGFFNSRMTRLSLDELNEYLKLTEFKEKIDNEFSQGSLTYEQALTEAKRCFQCRCRKKDNCSLREYSDIYEANQSAFKGEQPKFTVEIHSNYIFEMGKCIKCGICTQISARANLKSGHIFMNRSFELKVGLPFGPGNDMEFSAIVKECIEKCPTGALSNREE